MTRGRTAARAGGRARAQPRRGGSCTHRLGPAQAQGALLALPARYWRCVGVALLIYQCDAGVAVPSRHCQSKTGHGYCVELRCQCNADVALPVLKYPSLACFLPLSLSPSLDTKRPPAQGGGGDPDSKTRSTRPAARSTAAEFKFGPGWTGALAELGGDRDASAEGEIRNGPHPFATPHTQGGTSSCQKPFDDVKILAK